MAEVDVGGALYGLGEIFGGLGQIQSGGRLPNVAAQMRQAYEQRRTEELDRKMRERALQMQQERAEIEKTGKAWETVKLIRDLDVELDDDKVTQLGQKIAKDAGDETLAETFARALKNGDFYESIERFGQPLIDKIGLKKAKELFKKSPEQFEKMLGQAKSMEASNKILGAAESMTITRDASAEDIEKAVPGALGLLSEDDVTKLHRGGFKGIKPKGVMEAEAKAGIETAATTAANKRHEESLEQQRKNQERLAEQFNKSFALAQQREGRLEEQNRRLLPSQQKTLTGNRTAIKAIDDYSQAYEEFVKESGGAALSDIFRGAIAKNTNAQRAADLVTVQGRTPAEKKLAAKYNALVGNIRNLTDEVGVLTDVDAVRILNSFNPAQDRNQVRANLQERKKTHLRAYETAIEDYEAMGKDTSKFTKPSGGPTPTLRFNPATGKVEPIK